MKSKKKEEIYNVRDYVILPQEGVGKNVELVYDKINLLCLTIGKDKISEIFCSPLEDLVPRFISRLTDAYNDDLLHAPLLRCIDSNNISPEILDALLRELIGRAGKLSVSELLVCNRADIDQPTVEAIKKFRKAGFQIPIPVNVPVELGVLMGKALDELIHATSGWSFLDLFAKSKHEAPQRAINAVYGVKLLGLFKWLHNGQCCSPLTSQCVTTYDKSYCQTNFNGECTVLSDPCRRKEARGVK